MTSAFVRPEDIVVGCDAIAIFEIVPPDGMTNAEVVTALTGATLTASIVDTDGSTEVVAGASLIAEIDEGARLVQLSMTAAVTAVLTPGVYRWNVYITTSGGSVWPFAMREAQVYAL